MYARAPIALASSGLSVLAPEAFSRNTAELLDAWFGAASVVFFGAIPQHRTALFD